MGAKILAGLPEKHSLTPEYVAGLLESKPTDLVAVVVLRPKKRTDDLENDEAEETLTFRIAALEHMEGMEGQQLLDQLRKRHADRTGENMLPGMDVLPEAEPVDTGEAIPGSSAGDPKEYDAQVKSARARLAAEARIQAGEATDAAEAKRLEDAAEEYEEGRRDDEVVATFGPAFSDDAVPAEAPVALPAKAARKPRRGQHLRAAE